MSTAGKTIDIPDLINNNKIGSFQIGMLILCGLCVIMDGFDVQAMGYVAPAIIADWHVSKANLGPVFGAGLLGMLVGSLVFSITADKFGRRPVLIGSTIFFSLCMLVTPLATGSIIGPVLGGELIRLNWPNSTIFLVVAIPAIVSAVMVFAMRGGPQTAAKA